MNSKILLVFPPIEEDHGVVAYRSLPMGLLVVASTLQRAGYSPEILDCALSVDYEAELLQKMRDEDLLYVGMSVMTSQVGVALQLAELIKKERSTLPIVWGGFHATLFPEQTCLHPSVDIAVVDEGEVAAVEIADALKNQNSLEEVAGICFSEGGVAKRIPAGARSDFSSLPVLDYGLVDIERYISQPVSRFGPGHAPRRSLPLLTGLGCKYRCAFCINAMLRRPYRTRSAASIIEQTSAMVAEYGIEDFSLVDEHFFGDKERLAEFLKMKEESGMVFTWDTNVRANDFADEYLTVELLRRLESAGLIRVGIGAESGSQRILNFVGKGIKVDHIRSAARALSQTRIQGAFSFMVGLPSESVEEYDLTYGLCDEVMRLSPASTIIGPQVFRPYPGSKIYDMAVRDYQLPSPSTLEEWGGSATYAGYFEPEAMPWIEKPKAVRIRSFYMDRRKSTVGRHKGIFEVGIRALKWISASRLRRKLYAVPFEYYAYQAWRTLRAQ